MKKILVPKHIYVEVKKLERGESTVVHVHLHASPNGKHEIVSEGRRPIRCQVNLAERKSARRGVRKDSILVKLTKK